jgi:hypothetical protein
MGMNVAETIEENNRKLMQIRATSKNEVCMTIGMQR